MLSQRSSDVEKATKHTVNEVDSGFLSCSSRGTLDSMRVSENSTGSGNCIRDLRLVHSNINDLEKKQRSEFQITTCLNVKWSDDEKDESSDTDLDIIGQSPETFFSQDSDGDTKLHTAISMGYVEATLWLIGKAPNPSQLDIINYSHQTALHLAVITKQAKIVRKLVVAGASTKMRTAAGNTALHIACNIGDLACVEALTEPVTDKEKTWLANNSTFARIAPILPGNLELRNYDGKTPLHIAACKGHVDVVKKLIHQGADVTSKEGLAGKTALHIAVEENCLQVIEYLANQCSSCLDVLTYAGTSAYEMALDVDPKIAADLLRFGASDIVRAPDTDSCDTNSEDDCDDFSTTLAYILSRKRLDRKLVRI